ncbi:MAG: hypothetical protein JWM31_2823 [Solirubrobacterales bacterium]|nr:hypothetical protein [Solirubrobacterales bacterium]
MRRAPSDDRGVLHATSIVMEGADELIAGSRDMLDHSGSPAYVAVARCDDGVVVAGACAFGSERAARSQARTLRSTLPGAHVYVMERLVRGGRVRWTVWDGERDERLHQAFEEAPDTFV